VDFNAGTPTGVNLTVTGGDYDGTCMAGHGAEPGPGTDAYTVFNGVVSSQGAISYVDQTSSPLVLTFSGMDSSKTYELVYHAHRNDYAWDRAGLVTLSGAAMIPPGCRRITTMATWTALSTLTRASTARRC
jgi:hypothetical protein